MSRGFQGYKTVERAVELLYRIAGNQNRFTFSELCRQFEMEKSSLHRMLKSLEGLGLVSRVDGRYRLGYTLLELGSMVEGPSELRHAAKPHMIRLNQVLGTSVQLTVMEGTKAVCLDKVDSPDPVHITARLGSRVPLYTGASAKVLLAFLPCAEQESLLAQQPLRRYSDNCTISVEELRAELVGIRQKGYAFSKGEVTIGFCAIAAPIWSPGGQVVASLGVQFPQSDNSQSTLAHIIDTVVTTANKISDSLKSNRPRPTTVPKP